jgi:hypothetical protein
LIPTESSRAPGLKELDLHRKARPIGLRCGSTASRRLVEIAHEFLEAERMGYAIRPAVNPDLQNKIGCLHKRPAGGIRCAFICQLRVSGAGWKPGRVVAKVEWHRGKSF